MDYKIPNNKSSIFKDDDKQILKSSTVKHLHIALTVLLSLGMLLCFAGCNTKESSRGYIYTVNGKIPVEELGFSLTHEHIMSTFGAPIAFKPKYDKPKLFGQTLPYLKKIKSLGVKSIFDCTAAYFGRDVNTLKQLADSTDLQLVTNTGIYAAGNDRYVPEYAYEESIGQLAQRWVSEFENGIDGTEIRPGFVKLAFDTGQPSEIDLKLFEAGAITHKNTGLTLVTHTGNNPKAVAEQLSLLKTHKVDPSAWVWAHAHSVEHPDTLITIAKQGGWISLDGVRMVRGRLDSLAGMKKHLDFLQEFKKEKLLHKVLLSHDGNSYPNGERIRPYEEVMLYLIPTMKENGFTESEIDLLMVKNPQEAFAIRPRMME